MGLTCDIEGDRGRMGGIALQLAGELGALILIDDGIDAHAATILLVSIIQFNHSAIPPPFQLLIVDSASKNTDQRHYLFSLSLDYPISAWFGGGLDVDDLERRNTSERFDASNTERMISWKPRRREQMFYVGKVVELT